MSPAAKPFKLWNGPALPMLGMPEVRYVVGTTQPAVIDSKLG